MQIDLVSRIRGAAGPDLHQLASGHLAQFRNQKGDETSNFHNKVISTSGSRTSTHGPAIFMPAILSLASSIPRSASVSSYSPRGDLWSLAIKSNTSGRKM